MSNGHSRRKGVRGEQDIAKRLGGQRVGIAYLQSPVDVATSWCVVQVKNRTVGGAIIAEALKDMEPVSPGLNRYVVFKVQRRWYIAETLEQFIDDRIGQGEENGTGEG